MQLPLSAERTPRLLDLASVPSTNAELVRLAAEQPLPGFTTVVTDDQTDGRGRRGRDWTAPAGSSLAISVLLRPVGPDGVALPADLFSWLPLAGGLAMCDAIAPLLPEEAAAGLGVKWPNDVLIAGRKVCGVLGELLPDGDGVVLGAGVNTAMTAVQLPVPTATSLAIEGAASGPGAADGLADRVLSGYLARLRDLVDDYAAHGGDAGASGLRSAVIARCLTLGREVRAELPGGAELRGTAVDIDHRGRLVIDTGSGRVEPIAAGDVIHLR